MSRLLFLCFNLCLFCLFCFQATCLEKIKVRVGHFPNITHAQGLIGHQLTRREKGWFEERLGSEVEVQWFVYNAGPSAMEAIFADSIDLTYVGPSPTINAYLKSKGEEIRVICGACSGGAALIVQSDESIQTAKDFKGKKLGTPQFGNTQDVAARAWLKSQGFHITLAGGDVQVIPTPTASQLLLFKNKQLDALWTIEPWVSEVVIKGNGRIFFEESTLWPETGGKYITTHLVSSSKFLREHASLAKKWIDAHVELTEWIQKNPEQAKELVAEEIKKETRVSISEEVLNRAWLHMDLTYDPIKASLIRYANEAYHIGFIKNKPDLENIFHLQLLNAVLTEKSKATIP